MYKIVNIARVIWSRLELILVIGTIIVGLSLLGGFVAHQVIDWKQSHNTDTK